MNPYGKLILAWLKDDQETSSKQRHTARRVSFGSLPIPGEAAEVGWGAMRALINGDRRQVHLFVVRMSYSGVCFAKPYPSEKSEAFFDVHVQVFQ